MKKLCLALALLVLAACGGGEKDPSPRRSAASVTPTSTVPSSVSPDETPPGTEPGPGSGTPTAAGGPSPSPTRPDHVEGTRKARLVITMGKTCLDRGETQTITIRSDPGLSYSYGTLWPDGQAHSEWAAFGLGSIPPGGMVVHSWQIPVNAPRGTARTDVSVAGKYNGEDSTRFGSRQWRISGDC